MIAFVWLVSAMWIIPIVFWEDWDPDTESSLHSSAGLPENNKFSKNCDTKFSDNVLFKLTASALNFYIPMVLMIVLYFKIFMEVKKRSKFAIGENQICYATQAVGASPGRSISRKALAKDVEFISEGNESISAHEEPINKVQGGTPSSSSGSNNHTTHKHLVVSAAAKQTKKRRKRKTEEDGLSSENPSDWEDKDSGNSAESNKSTVVVPNTCTPCLMHVRSDTPAERKRNPPSGAQGSTSATPVVSKVMIPFHEWPHFMIRSGNEE